MGVSAITGQSGATPSSITSGGRLSGNGCFRCRLLLLPTKPVVPDPLNGYRTTPRVGQPARMQGCAISLGMTAK